MQASTPRLALSTPPPLRPSPSLAPGGAPAPTRDMLVVSPPREGAVVDLRPLALRGVHVLVHLPQDGPCTVLLPPGPRLQAVAATLPLRHKPRLHLADEKGQLAARDEVMPALAYLSTPRDPHGRPVHDPDQSEAVHSVRLNMSARFDRKAAAEADLDSSYIACRHLALRWIQQRHAWQADKAAGRLAAGDFYAPYKDADSLQQNMPASLQADFERLVSTRGHVPMPADQVPQYLRGCLRAMSTGQARYYLLRTGGHVLAIELRKKWRPDGHSDCVINVYDPNRTATHVRTVVDAPDSLPGTWLPAVLGRGEVSLTPWLPPREPLARPVAATGSLAGLPAPAPLLAIAAELAGRMELGDAPAVGPLVRHLVDAAMGEGLHGLRVLGHLLRAADERGMPALYRSMRHGYGEAALAYAHAVLALPMLSTGTRFKLLRASYRDGRRALGVTAAENNGAAAVAFARLLLAAPPRALTRKERLALFNKSPQALGGRTLLADVLLMAIKRSEGQPWTLSLAYAMTHEIAVSCRLGMADKLQMLAQAAAAVRAWADEDWRVTADQLRRPMTAMLNGILDAPLPWSLRRAMVPEQVMDFRLCLQPPPAPEPDQDKMLGHLAQLPRTDAWVRSMASAAHTAKLPVRLPAAPTADPLSLAPALGVTDTGVSPEDFVRAGLRWLAPDSSCLGTVCVADIPLRALAPYELLPQTRIGQPPAQAGRVQYLVPRQRLVVLLPVLSMDGPAHGF